jgi:hypothetical protein
VKHNFDRDSLDLEIQKLGGLDWLPKERMGKYILDDILEDYSSRV